MWFAKWFGGRSEQDDEPARFAPVPPKPAPSAKRSGNKQQAGTEQVNRGFDPYNSGSFDRNQAWGRFRR